VYGAVRRRKTEQQRKFFDSCSVARGVALTEDDTKKNWYNQKSGRKELSFQNFVTPNNISKE
jgi:hypothetical protein